MGASSSRLLLQTSIDLGHQCAEFQLLDASRAVWARYEWVLYCSGPDEYITPLAVQRIDTLISEERNHDNTLSKSANEHDNTNTVNRTNSKHIHASDSTIKKMNDGGEAPALLVFPFPRPSPPPRFCGFRGNASLCVRMSRWSLDLFLFRPAGGFLPSPRATNGYQTYYKRSKPRSILLDETTESIWSNATALCAGHRAYSGLAESVFWWMQATWSLKVQTIGRVAPLRSCKIGHLDESAGPCSEGSSGVWHTHNSSAVQLWLLGKN